MSDKNKALMRRVYDEVYSQGRLNVIDELTASDIVLNLGSRSISGRNAIKRRIALLRQGFPDLTITIEAQFAAGDRVVSLWWASGTHKGAFKQIAATGKRFTVRGIEINRFAANRSVESWIVMDELSLIRQLGIVPALTHDVGSGRERKPSGAVIDTA